VESQNNLSRLQTEVYEELTKNILPYWLNLVDIENGGFYGQVDAQNILHKHADKGGILHARILWTFSAAYRLLKNENYLQAATVAKIYLIDKFIDKEFGGIYWKLDYLGNPVDTKKQIYNMAFSVYGLSEYYIATGDKSTLNSAIQLFYLIEKHSFDTLNNGYFEAFTRHWQDIGDMRLSEKDANEKKTMNTHLHVLEAYTNLYRAWKSPELKKQLRNLIEIFIDKIIDKNSYHLGLFFDEKWHLKSKIISYGHDIEAAWLINEAAKEIADKDLLDRTRQYVCPIVDAAMEGYQSNNGFDYEHDPQKNHTDKERHWWVQAEAIVGALEAFKISNNEKYIDVAVSSWHYIQQRLIDKKYGEWYWSRLENGEIHPEQDKVGFWKCPYHNGRMCLKVMGLEIFLFQQ
jgi:mannobiose 2-epimerase